MKRTALGMLTLLASASMAVAQQTYPVALEPLGSGVNSPENDYAPFVTGSQDTLYFTSSRGGRASGRADIFATTRDDHGWTNAMNAGAVNTERNEGALSIAADGRTVVFASDAHDGLGDADLYIGELVGGTVTNIRGLGRVVNTRRWESQPAISGDGSTVYFTSNRPGGIGGADLWMSRRGPSGEWEMPVNLGPSINSDEDELSPFVTRDGGTLFFSTNRREGFGGLDVVMCAVIPEGGFSEPLNLGASVNSSADDIFFSAPAGSRRFYLASTRSGGDGGLDIYAGAPNVFGGGMFRMRIAITDSTTGAPLPGTIAVVVEEEDGSFSTIASAFDSDGEHVIYLPAGRRYRVSAQAKGYLMRSELVEGVDANTETRVDLRCGGEVLAAFELGEYDVPFFVTGYYRPNTPANLAALDELVDTDLRDATYIERLAKGSRRHRQYQAYAKRVEEIFASVTGPSTRAIFTALAASGNADIIEITITGFADPQPFTGRYVEPERVVFDDRNGAEHVLETGATIGNLELSGLRAWHSGRHLDAMLADQDVTGGSDYDALRVQGRIRYRYVAGDVRDDGDDPALQRRITVTIVRKGGGPTLPVVAQAARPAR